MLHVWYIYLYLGHFRANVVKYSSTMEHMGKISHLAMFEDPHLAMTGLLHEPWSALGLLLSRREGIAGR
jgi:hypothetical protein